MRAVAAFAATAVSCSGSATASRSSPRPGSCPGALLRNASLRFAGRDGLDRAPSGSTRRSPTRWPPRRPLRMPVAHGEGRYYADDATLDALEARWPGPVPLRRTMRRPGRPGRPGEPERLAPGDRRRAQRGRQRRGPDAASGARAGGDPRLGRRARIIRSLVESAARGGGRERRIGPVVAGGRRGDGRPSGASRAAPSVARHHRRGARRDPRPARRRDPNDLELAMFSVMWSEHCSYKSIEAAAAHAADRRRGRRRRARARTPGSSRSATGSPSRSRSSRTTTPRRSSRTRAPRRASAGSCATSSRWARGRSRSSTRSASATRRSADAPPGRRRRPRRRRLRQLRRRADGRRRARVRSELPGQPARQRHGHRPASRSGF